MKDREFIKLECKSNLGYVKGMTVDVFMTPEIIILKFSTGFETEAEFLKEITSFDENKIRIYKYEVSSGETHYLHVRTIKGGIYFQTVQTGLSPGGSTFNTVNEKIF